MVLIGYIYSLFQTVKNQPPSSLLDDGFGRRGEIEAVKRLLQQSEYQSEQESPIKQSNMWKPSCTTTLKTHCHMPRIGKVI